VVIYKKKSKNHVSFEKKTETSLVTWLDIVTVVARSVRVLPAHMHEDTHATQLYCGLWSGQCHARHAANAASVHQCCAPMTDRLATGQCPISCIIDRVEVRTVRWPQIRWNESRLMPALEVVQCEICQNSNF